MAYYSLVASLPALQIGDEAPFSTEEYIGTCAQWVTDQETAVLRALLLGEGNSKSCPHCLAWNNIETQLRNSSLKQRAQKLGVDAKEYIQPHDGFSGTIEVLVTDAFTRNDPVELEQELDRARWQLAEELIGLEPFSFEKVLAYGIQLKIVERWNNMDVHIGKEKLEAVITENTKKEKTTK
jgi:hypothetical protein